MGYKIIYVLNQYDNFKFIGDYVVLPADLPTTLLWFKSLHRAPLSEASLLQQENKFVVFLFG